MIIGISSKMGCGKTTLSDLIIKELPFKRKAFADLLKEECSEVYEYPLEWNYTTEGKLTKINHKNLPKQPMSIREILQWYGTDFRRKKYGFDYWVKLMDKEIKDDEDIVIDDVRFLEEAKFIKKREGLLVRLEPYPGWEPEKYSDHISETALDDYCRWDLVLKPKFGKLKDCVPLIKSYYEIWDIVRKDA